MLKVLNKNRKIIKPKAVLFDTDNTLYEYEPANKKATKAVGEKLNNLLGITEQEFLIKLVKA